jgi:glycosyltransferase involved in cell wall biosynthesis
VPLDHPASLPNPLGRLVYRRVLERSLVRATRVIVPSPATKERLVQLGADPERIDVVPLGVGPGFRPSTAVEREEARRRFAGGRRYVVASTGARAHKNLAGLARAAALLPEDVLVVATGRLEAPRVRFVGELGGADLALLYGGAEAMVLPAFVEGFGLPAVEALACGVPVVCGPRTGALPFLGAGAVVADVGDPADLASAVRTVLDGRRPAAGVSELTAGAMAAATVAVYDRAVSR